MIEGNFSMTDQITAHEDQTVASIMAQLVARHNTAREELTKIDERTDENAVRFDTAAGSELALHNAIMTLQEDPNANSAMILHKAGMSPKAAVALTMIKDRGRYRYEAGDEMADGFQALLDEGLADNISSHYPAGSKGICLNHAGTIIARLIA